MDFKYYQYKLGTAELAFGEMHSSLHSIDLKEDFLECKGKYIKQIQSFLIGDKPIHRIIKKHLERGINLSDSESTILIDYPEFPFQEFEPGYTNSKFIKYGLVGSEIGYYKVDSFFENYYFFYETSHPFSQWHKSKFIVDNIEFNSAEQYMMYSKALLFDDKDTALLILKSRNVREQKQLGREVKRFDSDKWNEKAPDFVYQGNMAKFTQNKDFLELLISTKGNTIVEASPTDEIWGIGLSESDNKSKDIFDWRGTNWLGIVLTELREELLENNFTKGFWTRDEFMTNKK